MTAIRIILTVLTCWGAFSLIWWAADRLPLVAGYWATMAIVGGSLLLAALWIVVLALIWTAGR